MTGRKAPWWLVAAVSALWHPTVSATNSELQALFFSACDAPSGQLAARCAETNDGAGDLSGDSESSLNPSQMLAGNQTAVRAALGRSDDALQRADPTDDGAGSPVKMGRFSLLFDFGFTAEQLDKIQDADRERGFEADTWNVNLGFDYRLSDASFAGLLLTYDSGDLDFDQEAQGTNFMPASTAGNIDSDSIGIVAFASFGIGSGGYLDVSTGYQTGDVTYERRSVFQESNRVIRQTNSVTKGSADQDELWASVNVGWQAPVAGWSLGVYGGLTFTDSEIEAFSERDATETGLGMRFSSLDRQSLVGTLGTRLQRPVSISSGVLIPYLRVEYAHEFEDDITTVAAGYLLDSRSNSLQLQGDKIDQDFFIASTGLSAAFPNGWIPFVDVSYWAGYEDLDRLRVQAGIRKEL